jgi:tetraacyldisaccharide 4'-kinase
VPLADLAESVWYGQTPASRMARAALTPWSLVYGAVVARRNASIDRTTIEPGPIPALSIGNLTVGGTGKTPVSAWFARRLVDAGAMPAIVLRGYGADEIEVHRLLNPMVSVHWGADRAQAVRAAALGGADVAILDDAFQHRRAARVADVVLVSADRWTGEAHLLPAGPFREPVTALRRADLVLVTTKAADSARVAATCTMVRRMTSSAVVTVDLSPASFVAVASGEASATTEWRGRHVLSVSAIGDPDAFHVQLERLGLRLDTARFRDHHAYTASDVRRLIARASSVHAVVCTLKDAVKLGPLWPGSGVPLWYLSQSVVPRDGTESLNAVVQKVLAARRVNPPSPDLSR